MVRIRIVKVLLILATLCLSVTAQQQRTITGKVVSVTGGDTITLLDAEKRQHKIRLDGIDAPEEDQAFGDRAKKSLSDLVLGKTVTVTGSKVDRSGRMVGKVTRDDKDIGLRQIERGMAWFYRKYANELSQDDARVYEQAETDARAKSRGLWASPGPIPPWELRAAHGQSDEWEQEVESGPIIGDRNSKIYHRPGCLDYPKVAEQNRILFKTEQEAVEAGYRKARNCP
ncbi:MAG: thermonuclease family protein [Blastocatellia bacterium]